MQTNMQANMQTDTLYLARLSNGQDIDIIELAQPVFPCFVYDDTSKCYLTQAELEQQSHARHCHTIPDAHALYVSGVGYVRGWTELFAAYKALRTDIIKLERI